jgi:hypothetical protein
MSGTSWSAATVSRVWELYGQHATYNTISQETGVPISTARAWITGDRTPQISDGEDRGMAPPLRVPRPAHTPRRTAPHPMTTGRSSINFTPDVVERGRKIVADAREDAEHETIIAEALSEHADQHYRMAARAEDTIRTYRNAMIEAGVWDEAWDPKP